MSHKQKTVWIFHNITLLFSDFNLHMRGINASSDKRNFSDKCLFNRVKKKISVFFNEKNGYSNKIDISGKKNMFTNPSDNFFVHSVK